MKILLLAGESSGELYARTLRQLLAPHEIRGYGDYGFRTCDLAVMGIWAVLRRARYFLNVKRTMIRALDDWRPDVVCTIDYPGMNLRLAAAAKARGIRTVHVVSPQVWAWKKGRIPKIEAAIDRLLCFFPFEPALYKPGFATFVGHPLVEAVAETRARLGADKAAASTSRLVALLPGSRLGEIARNLPPLLQAAQGLKDIRIEIPAAHAAARKAIDALVAAWQASGASRPPVRVLDGGARELLLRAGCAAVASGTATLEAALARCPTVLVYRVSPLFAWLARRFIWEIRHIGLINIIWEKTKPDDPGEPMPELLQEAFTPEAVAAHLASWLDDPLSRASAVARLDAACRLLDAPSGAMARIAHAILDDVREEKR